MLDELTVRNAGILADATIEPGGGLVVVTGETGAGKTLLLGALRLLLGDTARKDLVGPAGDELVVEGRIVTDATEVVARRRVTRQGRSRAHLDGEMVSARTLTSALGPVVEIVAQHDAMRLSQPEGVRDLVDGVLDSEGAGVLQDYRGAFGELRSLEERRLLLGGDRRALERELDMVRFQADDIESAGFATGDEKDLRSAARLMRNVEAVGEELGSAAEALGGDRGAMESLGRALDAMTRLGTIESSFEPLKRQLGEIAELLSQAHSDVSTALGELDRDPAALERVERRLSLLGDLRRKYGVDLDEVLKFEERARVRAATLVQLLSDAESIDADLEKLQTRVAEIGGRLRAVRSEAAARLAAAAVDHLRDLGLSDPLIEFDVSAAAASAQGADRIDLRFASDRSLPAGQAARIASGGELSRLVLALRLASGGADAPIVAFDEVDAGIGGTTALAMGRKLRELARDRQVLCVTHLPQVAAHAGSHFVVRRDGAIATVQEVSGDDRLEELTRMLAGLAESDKGRDHAAELLARAQA